MYAHISRAGDVTMKKITKPSDSEQRPSRDIPVRGFDYKLAYRILLEAYLARPLPLEPSNAPEDAPDQLDRNAEADKPLE